jgi:hypothetical protein
MSVATASQQQTATAATEGITRPSILALPHVIPTFLELRFPSPKPPIKPCRAHLLSESWREQATAILDSSPHKSPHNRGKEGKLGNALSLYGRVVNRAGLEPATRCCIQKCYAVGSSSISLRHTSRFCTVFGTVLFPNLLPDSQKCNELEL